MIMTAEEQHDILKMIQEVKEINKQKTDLMEELIYMAQAIVQQNEVLTHENENLKRQLEIAERAILRSNEPQS